MTAREIRSFFHCKRCVETIPAGFSARDYMHLEVGLTEVGDIQVWCTRHEEEVVSLNSGVAAALAEAAAREKVQRAAVYTERNRLVAMLAALYPSSLERHPDSDTSWEDDWRWIVFIDLPTGQASWHIHDSELPLFDHVQRLRGRTWDGHTTEAKYARLEAAARAGREDS